MTTSVTPQRGLDPGRALSNVFATGQGFDMQAACTTIFFFFFCSFSFLFLFPWVKDKRNMQQCATLGCARDRNPLWILDSPSLFISNFSSLPFFNVA